MPELWQLDDDGLAAALREMRPEIAWPDADVSGVVLATLRAEPVPDRSRTRRLPAKVAPRNVRVALTALLVTLLIGGAAIATTIGVPGIRLRPVEGTSEPTSGPLVTNPGFLGPVTTLDAAEKAIGGPLAIPAHPALGEPEVHVRGAHASLVYRANPDLPAIGNTAVGLVVTQFPARLDRDLLEKLLDGDVRVESVSIGGIPGWWIEGRHTVLVVEAGAPSPAPAATSGDSLLFTRGDLTIRIESAAGRVPTIAIAESLNN